MKIYRHTKTNSYIEPAEDFTVEEMTLCDNGEPEALISIRGELVHVTHKHGSWETEPDENGRSAHIMTEYAAALNIAYAKMNLEPVGGNL